MSFFSGLTNQVSGFIASKTGQGEPAQEGVDPNMQQPQQDGGVNGGEYAEQVEGGEQQQPAGGMSGFAGGLMMKAMAAKDGMKEKAGAIGGQAAGLGAMGGQMLSGVTKFIPGQKQEEEVPMPPEQQGYEQQGDIQYTEGGEQVQYTE